MNDEFNNQDNINLENNNINNEDVINKIEDSISVSNQNNIIEVENTNVSQNNNLEQSNENIYNKKNNNSSIPVIIMFIVLILFVFVFLGNEGNLFSSNNKHGQNNGLIDNNDSNKDNLQEEDMNDKDNQTNDKVDEENIVTKYLKYVPYLRGTLVNSSYSEIYDDAYFGESTNINNINKNILLYSAITNTKTYDFYQGDRIPVLENGYMAFSYHKVDEVIDYLNKVYNIDNSKLPNEIKIPGGTIILQDNYYLPIMGAGAASYEKYVYSTTYHEENDKLIIEEDVLFYFYYDSKCNVYANTNDMHNEKNQIDIFNIDYSEVKDGIDLKKYINKTPSKYKHIFKKINNEYVWYSTEVVKNNSIINKLNYEIKVNGTNKELYVNDKKVNGIKAYNELGNIEVKEFNDLLIVDETNPGPSRKLFVVDKNGNASEMDYKVSTYSNELRNSINSYRIEGNNLYIKINRFQDGRLDWYCYLENKNEVAEYEVKYEYVNGKLGNREILNEVTIADKYKNVCN